MPQCLRSMLNLDRIHIWIKVCHKEIKWKVPLEDIPLAKSGADYNARQVPNAEIKLFLDLLENLVLLHPCKHMRDFFQPKHVPQKTCSDWFEQYKKVS